MRGRRDQLCLSKLGQLLASYFAHAQLLAIREYDGPVAVTFPIDFTYSVEIDNGRSMNANELPRVELVAQVSDGLAEHVRSSIGMETAVICRCSDPIYFLDWK